jgi:hypothetical protein
MAAQSLHHSKSARGDFYRRMRGQAWCSQGHHSRSPQFSRIIFHLITTRQEFDDSRFTADQLRHQKRQEAKLRAKAKDMGFELIPSSRVREFLRSPFSRRRSSTSGA